MLQYLWIQKAKKLTCVGLGAPGSLVGKRIEDVRGIVYVISHAWNDHEQAHSVSY
jgi:hypothetical protein